MVAAAVEVMAAAEQEAEGSAPVASEEAVMDSAEVLSDAVDSRRNGRGATAERQEDWQEEPDAAGWADMWPGLMRRQRWRGWRLDGGSRGVASLAPKVVQQVVEQAVEMAARQEAAVEVACWAASTSLDAFAAPPLTVIWHSVVHEQHVRIVAACLRSRLPQLCGRSSAVSALRCENGGSVTVEVMGAEVSEEAMGAVVETAMAAAEGRKWWRWFF